jgi:hypothetical protein
VAHNAVADAVPLALDRVDILAETAGCDQRVMSQLRAQTRPVWRAQFFSKMERY